jgi:hypothetical protein
MATGLINQQMIRLTSDNQPIHEIWEALEKAINKKINGLNELNDYISNLIKIHGYQDITNLSLEIVLIYFQLSLDDEKLTIEEKQQLTFEIIQICPGQHLIADLEINGGTSNFKYYLANIKEAQ